MGRLVYVTGPARSGKSSWAVARARQWGTDVAFVATYRAGDDLEMNERIRRHRSERPDWRTIEAPANVAGTLAALRPPPSGAVIDCLTLWLSERLASTDEEILGAWVGELRAIRSAPWPALVVGNEVGWALVPDAPLLRRFRDLAGWLSQRTAAAADEAWLLVAGCPLRLK